MKACRGAVLGSAVSSLLVVILTGCASTPSGPPVSAWVSYRHFERGESMTLVTRGFEDFEAIQRSGRLSPNVKLVDAEAMGGLVRVLERRGFFRRAEPISVDAPGLEGRVAQVLSYRDERGNRTLLYSAEFGQDFVDMKEALREVYNQTFSLTVSNEPLSRKPR